MGKVKNLIWDEIEHDTECIMTPPVTAVPTQQDLSDAAQASYDAFEVFWSEQQAGQDTTESHAAYMGAIERHAELRFQRNQALLKEAGVCSI